LLKDCVGWFCSVRSLFEHDPDAEFVVWVMPSFWKFWNPCFSFSFWVISVVVVWWVWGV
jgi:hypothetical protein